MKESNLLGKTLKQKVKEIIGTCNSMGVLVEGKTAAEAIQMINKGEFDKEIKAEKTELTADEKAELEKEKEKLQKEIEVRRAEFEKKAKDIINSMVGKPRGTIKAKLKEEGIPDAMIKELLPVEGVAAAAGAGAAPAGEAEKKPAETKEE